ncbi:MAG: hypothetical protein R2702_01080 [Acidimicrobiales bacterium]
MADHVDRSVGEVVGDVVVVGVGVDLDRVVVLHEAVRLVEVGEGVEHAVVAIEAALARPAVPGPGIGQVAVLREVPLADRERVAGVAEDLGGGGHVVGQLGGVAGEAGVGVGHVAGAGAVRVDAGEQGRPGGRAHGRDVEVGEPQPAGREGGRGSGWGSPEP